LRTLAATEPIGAFLQLGIDTGLSTAWILAEMDATLTLISVDNDENVPAIARRHFGYDWRISYLADGAAFLESLSGQHFDLALLKLGALYISDLSFYLGS